MPEADYSISKTLSGRSLSLDAKKHMVYEIYAGKKLISRISEQEDTLKIPLPEEKCKIKTFYIGSRHFSEQFVQKNFLRKHFYIKIDDFLSLIKQLINIKKIHRKY